MSNQLAEGRKRRAFGLAALAAGFAAVAAVTVAIDYRASRPDIASGPVLPGLAESATRAQLITVTSREASYRIQQTQRGQTRVWTMRDRGNFPVNPALVERLTHGLEGLRFVRRMTSDASKHARLGVDDPRQGGRGVLVQIEDGNRALLADLVLGIEPNGGLFVRQGGQDQVWAARGELPPLRDISAWLDLRPLDLAAEALARVEVVPAEGRPYVLARADAGAPFAIVAPGRYAPSSQAGVDNVASRITQLQPVDVREAPAIQGAPRARVRVVTLDGLLIDGELIDSDNRTWLKLVARAQNPAQEAAALAVNNRVAAWAYGLSNEDVATLAAPLGTLLPQAPPRPAATPPA